MRGGFVSWDFAMAGALVVVSLGAVIASTRSVGRAKSRVLSAQRQLRDTQQRYHHSVLERFERLEREIFQDRKQLEELAKKMADSKTEVVHVVDDGHRGEVVDSLMARATPEALIAWIRQRDGYLERERMLLKALEEQLEHARSQRTRDATERYLAQAVHMRGEILKLRGEANDLQIASAHAAK